MGGPRVMKAARDIQLGRTCPAGLGSRLARNCRLAPALAAAARTRETQGPVQLRSTPGLAEPRCSCTAVLGRIRLSGRAICTPANKKCPAARTSCSRSSKAARPPAGAASAGGVGARPSRTFLILWQASRQRSNTVSASLMSSPTNFSMTPSSSRCCATWRRRDGPRSAQHAICLQIESSRAAAMQLGCWEESRRRTSQPVPPCSRSRGRR